MPRFSLLVVCRNAANYVVRSLAAIAKQTYGIDGVEVVFVDDGSSDFSYAVASKFGEDLPHFKLVQTRKKEGSGCGGARNEALNVATGEYIWHIDVDDYITKNALEKIDFAIRRADDTNKKKTDVVLFPFKTERPRMSSRKSGITDPVRDSLSNGVLGPVAAWAKVIRREVAVPFRPGIMAQDAAWHFLQYDRFETMASVDGPEPVYVYDRTNRNSASTTQEWTVDNPRTLEQLAFGEEVQKFGLNDKFFSDAIRSLADMYDVRHLLTKPWVREAWKMRFKSTYAMVMTGRYTH